MCCGAFVDTILDRCAAGTEFLDDTDEDVLVSIASKAADLRLRRDTEAGQTNETIAVRAIQLAVVVSVADISALVSSHTRDDDATNIDDFDDEEYEIGWPEDICGIRGDIGDECTADGVATDATWAAIRHSVPNGDDTLSKDFPEPDAVIATEAENKIGLARLFDDSGNKTSTDDGDAVSVR